MCTCVGGQDCSGANGVVIIHNSHVRHVLVPVVLLFTGDHGQHLGQDVLNTPPPPVFVGVECHVCNFLNTEAPIYRLRVLRENMQTVGGKKSRKAAPQDDTVVDEDVGRTFRRELGSSDDVHAGAAAEAIGKRAKRRRSPAVWWKGRGPQLSTLTA